MSDYKNAPFQHSSIKNTIGFIIRSEKWTHPLHDLNVVSFVEIGENPIYLYRV